LDGLVFLWPYGGVVRKAILGLKYKYASQVAGELASHAVEYLQKRKVVLPIKSTLVSIPLYWFRENWRGFNQVEEIGKLVASSMQWGFRGDLLIRKKLARPQTELRGKERRENIRGVFSLNPNYKLRITNYPPGQRPSRAGGQSLILFDDVLTTGATMKEAAKVLKRSGAKKVWGLTIAR
jgi:ComF family protein